MADKRISQLDPAAPLTGAEQVAVVQGGITKRAPVSGFLASSKTALRFVPLSNIDSTVSELQWVADAINANAPYSCLPGEQMVFFLNIQEEIQPTSNPLLQLPNLIVERRYYRLTTGAFEVNSVTANQIMPDGFFRLNLGGDIVINLGDIGSDAIEVAFNNSEDEPFVIDSEKFVIAVQNGVAKIWYWVGGNGTFGLSATPATDADFLDLSTQGDIPDLFTIINYTIFNQYNATDTEGDTGENLIQPDFGLPILTVEDMQEGNSYKGILVGKIDNQDDTTAKVITIEIGGQSLEIFNNTLVSGELYYFLNITLDFLNQSGDDIDVKVTIQGDVDGIAVREIFETTFDNTADTDIELTITGDSTDTMYLDKARIDR